MDLRNGRITIGEILANPNARAMIQRAYPKVLASPMAARFRGMQLGTAMQYAGRFGPRAQLDRVVARLKEL